MLAVARNRRSGVLLVFSSSLCSKLIYGRVPARLKVVPRLLSASKILMLDQVFRSRQLWGSRGGRRETLSPVIRRLLRVEVLDLALFFPNPLNFLPPRRERGF